MGWVFDRQIGLIRGGTRPPAPVHDGKCGANALRATIVGNWREPSGESGDVNLDKADMEPQISTRQAGAEIEVTDAMERAGDAAYLQWSAEAYPYREDHEWDLPARLYRAMEAARPAFS